MVYYEIALEPESIEDLKDLGLLERMFGFEHGRLIADFPAKPKETGSWGKLLLRHLLATLPPEKHKEIEIRLPQLLPKLIWRSRNASKLESGQEWFDLAAKEQGFSCLIGKGERDHPDWVPFQKLYSPRDTLPDCLASPIHYSDAMKDPETFLCEIEPLLFSANKISFIDPYFNPAHPKKMNACRWRNTAEKLAAYFRQSQRMTADFQFHTKYDTREQKERGMTIPSPEAFIQEIIDKISGYFPPTSSISVTAWSERKNGIPFHARYLITDKAGIALDYGSDLGSNRRTDVALMPLKFAEKRLIDFECKDASPFLREATMQTHGTS